MARYKELATILRDVDYKKPYRPNKSNTEMFFNILNNAILITILLVSCFLFVILFSY